MAVRILVAQVVEVGVAPGEPAARAGEQRRVEHLPVVVRGVVVGREVRADAELLEDDRLAEAACELARERRREQLADLVVLHRVGVRPEEVDQRGKRAQRVPVVAPGDLDPPGAVAERDRLRRARRADGLDEEPRPRGDLVGRSGAAVDAASRSRRATPRRRDEGRTAARSRPRTTPAATRARRRGRGRGRRARTDPSSRRTCGRRGRSGSSPARSPRARRGSRRTGRGRRRRTAPARGRSRASSRTSA